MLDYDYDKGASCVVKKFCIRLVRSALAAETREQLQKDVPKSQLVDFIGANATFLTEPYRTLPRVGVWVHKNNVFN